MAAMLDIIQAKAGHFFFRSRAISLMYQGLVLSRRRWKRSAGLAILALIYLVRTVRQFAPARHLRLLLLALLVGSLAAAVAAPPNLVALAAAAALAACAAALVLLAGSQLEDGIGHRGGAHGYTGPLAENTIEAAVALVQRDLREGPLPGFPYLEFDVQETADGELVVFHDALLSRAVPDGGTNADIIAQIEAEAGTAFQLLTVQDLSLAQLQSLQLGGRPGLTVPTLQQYLGACEAAGLRRSLAVEVKRLQTDAGRQRLVDIVGDYLERQAARLESDPVARQHRCTSLGWAGVIAFPHLFAASFGEYGSAQWRRWAAEFKSRKIPVRACHALWLPLTGWE